MQIFQNLQVVPDGEVQNPNLQISLSDARADDDPEAEVGEEHSREIIFEKFGRRAILNLRQTLQSRILDLQKDAVFNKFRILKANLSLARCIQTWSRETLLLDDEKTNLFFRRTSRSPATSFRKGEPYVRSSPMRG